MKPSEFAAQLLQLAAPEVLVEHEVPIGTGQRRIDHLIYTPKPHPIFGVYAEELADRPVALEDCHGTLKPQQFQSDRTKLSLLTEKWLRGDPRLPGSRAPALFSLLRFVPRTLFARLGYPVGNRGEPLLVRTGTWEHEPAIYYNPGTSADPNFPFLSLLLGGTDEQIASRIAELKRQDKALSISITQIEEAIMRTKFNLPENEEEYYVVKLRKAEAEAAERGMARGMAQGLEQGLEQGLKQGREQGLEQGREQGLEQGREQGLEQGREEEREARRSLLLRIAGRLSTPEQVKKLATITDLQALEAAVTEIIES